MKADDESTASELRALHRLAQELRDEPVPEIDWEASEERLLRQVALEAASRRRHAPALSAARSGGGRWAGVFGFAAAAAAVVALIAGAADDAELTGVEPARGDLVATTELRAAADGSGYDVGALPNAAVIASGDEAMTFTLPGVATWTLEPNSRVVVESRGMPHVVRLEEGSIRADVVPRVSSDELIEAFAVEANGTRVAVHGTSFSVARSGDDVTVEVTHGSVAVGPASHRGTSAGRVLTSPARAKFNHGRFVSSLPLSPAPIARLAPTQAPAAAAAAPTQPAQAEPVAAESTPPAPPIAAAAPVRADAQPAGEGGSDDVAVAEPTPPVPAKLSAAQARGLMVGCLGLTANADTDNLVTISSQVTVMLGADGAVTSLRFSPPLRPDLQQRCGGALFGKRLEGSGSVSFPVQFMTGGE